MARLNRNQRGKGLPTRAWRATGRETRATQEPSRAATVWTDHLWGAPG